MAIPPKKATTPVIPPKDNTLQIIGWLGLGLVILICYRWVSAIGLNLFTWGDRLFGASGQKPTPVWAFAGILPGVAVGAIVMARKYRLSGIWMYTPLGGMVLLLFVCCLSAESMEIFQPPPVAVVRVVDTAKMAPPSGAGHSIHRRHPKPESPVLDTNTTQGSASASSAPTVPASNNQILTETASVAIHARTDSVLLHYRITNVHGGNWSEWAEKTIPSAGQTLLTAGELVKAHAIQWWYEVGGTATRSEARPFSKDHCDGALVIDTY